MSKVLTAVLLLKLCLIPILAFAQPIVDLTLIEGNASEAGQKTGSFSITRTGDTAQHLDVILTLEGSADLNVDYSATSLSYHDAPNFYRMRIPVGQASLTSTLTPIFDELIEGNETAVFTLESTNQYEKGNSVEATISITDFVERIFKDGFEDL